MFLAIMDLCLTVIALTLTVTEIVLPLLRGKSLFPNARKLFQGSK